MATESFEIIKNNLHRDIDQVQLKAVRDHKTFYTAMVKKSDYQETQTKDWQEKNKDESKAFLEKVLTKEKHFEEGEVPPAPQPEGKTTAGAPTTTSTSTGGTPEPQTSQPKPPPASSGGTQAP